MTPPDKSFAYDGLKLVQPIWEFSPYPIAVIDLGRDPEKRKFFYVNPAFTALTG